MRRLVLVLLVAMSAQACSAAPKPEPLDIHGLRGGEIVAGSPQRLQEALRSWRGEPIVVNFWGSWCVPCRAEMPFLVSAAKSYGSDVHFLGVDVQDDPTLAKSFAGRFGISFPSLTDPKREIVNAHNILGMPVTEFYGSEGDLAFVHNGPIDEMELKRNLDQLILIARPARTPN